MVSKWYVAQLNVGTSLYPLDDPRMSGFITRLEDINALADASPGFVWRLQSDAGNATDIAFGEDPLLIVNMSVWQCVDALFAFAYESAHSRVMADRRLWFARPRGAYQVLWWVPAGHEPSLEEGMAKLASLDAHGASAEAFTFSARFAPPDCVVPLTQQSVDGLS